MNITIEMDVNMLYSILNTKLRNDYDSLEALCANHNLDIDMLKKKMKDAGYSYQVENKQFTTM